MKFFYSYEVYNAMKYDGELVGRGYGIVASSDPNKALSEIESHLLKTGALDPTEVLFIKNFQLVG